MNIPYVMKKCSKCGEWKVASTINFHRQKTGKYELQARCKKCRKQWRLDNKERIAEQRKQYRQDNKEKIAEQRKQRYEANREKILEQQKQYYENNKEKIAERNKRYYQNNKEKIAERNKQYCQDNREKILEYHKQWTKDNRDKMTEYYKQYRQSPQGQVASFNRQQKRRIREEQQGTGITKDQWLEMMQYFEFRCAYSGKALTKKTRSIDHIVPLNSNGDNMIWNVVPMTRSLNSSKQDKDMLEWYKEQDFYSEARLQKIYEWQEYAFSKWGKDSEYFNSGDIQIKLI